MRRVLLAALLASLSLCPALHAGDEDFLNSASLAELQAQAKDYARLQPNARNHRYQAFYNLLKQVDVSEKAN